MAFFDKPKKAEKQQLNVTVVPWHNPEQFKSVYEDLYSSDITRKRKAVDQISIWETRSHPSLPTAIECSVGITRAMINDVLYSNGSTLCTEADIQMMYCMALIRFVNLSIDVHQGPMKIPLASIADRLGIPSWIVDLRNEAAHSHSPTLQVLRMGAESVMKHLETSFWKSEVEKIDSAMKQPKSGERIASMIQRYQALQYFIVHDKLNTHMPKVIISPSMTPEQTKRERYKLLNKISNRIFKNRAHFIDVLIMDEHFIPMEDDLLLLAPEKSLIGILANDEEDEDMSIINSPKLPLVLELFWAPVIKILNAHQAIPDFVEALLYVQADKKDLGQKVIAAWCLKLFSISTLGPNFNKSPLTKIFHQKGLTFNWNRLLYAAIANPCKYTTFLLPLIMSHLDLKRKFVRSVMNLLAIYQGQALDTNFKSNARSVFTLDQLKIMKKLQDDKKEVKAKTENIWSLAPESIDFTNLPIGAIIQQPVDDEEEEEEEKKFFWRQDGITENMEIDHKFIWRNENDSEDGEEGTITVQPNTFNRDEQIICQRTSFLYKKKTL